MHQTGEEGDALLGSMMHEYEPYGLDDLVSEEEVMSILRGLCAN